MKNGKVFVVNLARSKMAVFYEKGGNIIYLFQTAYYYPFYESYRNGVSIRQVYADKSWRNNKAMARIVEHKLFRSLNLIEEVRIDAGRN